MNSEKILWNTYINIDNMERLERNFYNLHYKYRRFIYTAEKNKSNFRNSKAFTALLNELNNAYEKIHNCSEEKKNDLGEYEYPKVAYKVKFEKVNGKNVTKKYASVSETNCCRTIPIGEMFNFAPLYINGEVKAIKGSSETEPESLKVESSIKDIILFYKNNKDTLAKCGKSDVIFDAVSKLSDFPVDSITELDFNFFLDRREFDAIREDFFEKERKKSEKAIETQN